MTKVFRQIPKAVCDNCGFEYYYWDIRRNALGFTVCTHCWIPEIDEDKEYMDQYK